MKRKVTVISLIVLVMDRISKMLVFNLMKINNSIKILDDLLYITYVKNEGIAFSFLEGNRLFIILASIVVLGMILFYLKNSKLNSLEIIGFGMVVGGALGNLIDRIIYGYVIDFIDVYVLRYDYPIFNIADMGVVVGVIVILVSNFVKSKGSGDKLCK